MMADFSLTVSRQSKWLIKMIIIMRMMIMFWRFECMYCTFETVRIIAFALIIIIWFYR